MKTINFGIPAAIAIVVIASFYGLNFLALIWHCCGINDSTNAQPTEQTTLVFDKVPSAS